MKPKPPDTNHAARGKTERPQTDVRTALLETALTQIPRSRTLADEAYEQLRHSLISGQLRPGQAITVRGVAAALNISLTPAREAIGRLYTEGVLAEGPNRTVSVPRLTRSAYLELMTIRLALEPLAAGKAVSNLSMADLSALHALQDGVREAYEERDFKLVLRCNENFHFHLYRKSRMPALVQMIEGLWLRIGPTLTFLHESAPAGATWPGDINHREILAAVASRDGDRLGEAVRKDLVAGAERLLAILDNDDATGVEKR